MFKGGEDGEEDPAECDIEIQAPGAQLKGAKMGKPSKQKSVCACAKTCAEVEGNKKPVAWTFLQKKPGKPGKCQCLGGVKSGKCKKGNSGGYLEGLDMEDKKFQKA